MSKRINQIDGLDIDGPKGKRNSIERKDGLRNDATKNILDDNENESDLNNS